MSAGASPARVHGDIAMAKLETAPDANPTEPDAQHKTTVTTVLVTLAYGPALPDRDDQAAAFAQWTAHHQAAQPSWSASVLLTGREPAPAVAVLHFFGDEREATTALVASRDSIAADRADTARRWATFGGVFSITLDVGAALTTDDVVLHLFQGEESSRIDGARNWWETASAHGLKRLLLTGQPLSGDIEDRLGIAWWHPAGAEYRTRKSAATLRTLLTGGKPSPYHRFALRPHIAVLPTGQRADLLSDGVELAYVPQR